MTNPFEIITDRLNAIQNKVGEIDYFLHTSKQPTHIEPETFMTRQEVADLYKITIPTTYAWEKVGIFKPYKIANKTRFLRSEVLTAAKDISVKGGGHA
jgi:hypothetical protein